MTDLTQQLRAYGAGRRASSVRTDDRFPFAGGLNVADAPMNVYPGQCLGAKNFEPGVRGGYSRSEGYERVDGRTSPTNGEFTVVSVNNPAGSTFPGAGDTIREYVQGTTTLSATGTVATTTASSSTATTGWITVVNITGTFLGDGDIYINATAPGTPDFFSTVVDLSDAGSAYDTLYELLTYSKTEYLRSLIGAVGATANCSGPVRGVKVLKDALYAFRDNSGATAGTMWKATTSGWTSVALGRKVRFSTGVKEITEGLVLVGGTSGASATVLRVVSNDGSWGRNASGYFIVASITGTFTASEALKVGGTTYATYVSDAAQTLPAGGRYRFRNHNFLGADDQYRMYGVNGVGPAFEFDGTVFVSIETGMTTDTPTHVFVHNDHLGLTFPGGSTQNSGYQKPLNWNPITGADERQAGSDVTFVQELADRTTLICTRQKKLVLYGDVIENFQFRDYSSDTGAIENTGAKVGEVIFLDDIGYCTAKASAAFGNYQRATISDKINKYVFRLMQDTYPTAAQIVRRKNLYRNFFADGTGLVTSQVAGSKISGWMPIEYPVTVFCAESCEVEDGTLFKERAFIGCNDGYVYETDIGRSFDGEDIEAFVRLAYHHSKSPERFKRYRRAQVDLEIGGPTHIICSTDYDYGARGGQTDDPLAFTGGGGFWDVGRYSSFRWSQPAFDQAVMKIEGTGFNVGFLFYSKDNFEVAYTLHSVSLQYSPRRINRGKQIG